jgi:hypothetical protein
MGWSGLGGVRGGEGLDSGGAGGEAIAMRSERIDGKGGVIASLRSETTMY